MGRARLTALADAGLSGKDRVVAFRALLAYVLGTVQVEHLGLLSDPGTVALANCRPSASHTSPRPPPRRVTSDPTGSSAVGWASCSAASISLDELGADAPVLKPFCRGVYVVLDRHIRTTSGRRTDPDRRLFRGGDCSEVGVVRSVGGRIGGSGVGTIRGCRGTRAAGRRAGSGPLRCRAA